MVEDTVELLLEESQIQDSHLLRQNATRRTSNESENEDEKLQSTMCS